MQWSSMPALRGPQKAKTPGIQHPMKKTPAQSLTPWSRVCSAPEARILSTNCHTGPAGSAHSQSAVVTWHPTSHCGFCEVALQGFNLEGLILRSMRVCNGMDAMTSGHEHETECDQDEEW